MEAGKNTYRKSSNKPPSCWPSSSTSFRSLARGGGLIWRIYGSSACGGSFEVFGTSVSAESLANGTEEAPKATSPQGGPKCDFGGWHEGATIFDQVWNQAGNKTVEGQREELVKRLSEKDDRSTYFATSFQGHLEHTYIVPTYSIHIFVWSNCVRDVGTSTLETVLYR